MENQTYLFSQTSFPKVGLFGRMWHLDVWIMENRPVTRGLESKAGSLNFYTQTASRKDSTASDRDLQVLVDPDPFADRWKVQQPA